MRAVPTRLAVYSDKGLMTSVLQNLVSNAVRYTEEGEVLIGARRAGREVRLQVFDTGPGISDEERKRIFREFERGGRGARTDRGLGLGLAIVERIVKSLGHPIHVHSVEGRGSCFEVVLPRATARPVTRQSARRRAGASLEGLRILYIDNEPEVLEAGLGVMRRWGCEAVGAKDRDEALAAFPERAPDIVVLDYRLDDGDTGPAVYETACERWAMRPPGLLATAERGPEADEAARVSGLDVIRKPLAPAALRASLAALKRKSERG